MNNAKEKLDFTSMKNLGETSAALNVNVPGVLQVTEIGARELQLAYRN